MKVLQDLMKILGNFVNGLDTEEFKQKIKRSLFAELGPFLVFLPEDYAKKLKKTSFATVRKFLEKNCKEKARIISEEKRWLFLEKEFERLKRKI